MENENVYKKALIEQSVEIWKIVCILNTILMNADAHKQRRYTGKVNWFLQKTESILKNVGLTLINVEGQKYDSGMAVTVVNSEDLNNSSNLVVDKMLEPIVVSSDGLEKMGIVILKEDK